MIDYILLLLPAARQTFLRPVFCRDHHAFSARLAVFQRLVPRGEFAFWKPVAPVKGSGALARAALDQLPLAATGAFYAREMNDRLDAFAIGVSAASQKASEAARLYHHRFSALVAFFAGQLFFELNVSRRFFRRVERLCVFAFRII